MKNPIFKNINKGDYPYYQQYFLDALSVIDLQNFTNQTLGVKYNKKLIESDYKRVEKIFNKAKKEHGLSPAILQIMLEQYIWADIYLREIDKNNWIERVTHRKNEDYFPDSTLVYHNIFNDDTDK